MSKAVRVERVLNTVGDHIYRRIQEKYDDELPDEYRTWIDEQGLDRLNEPCRVVGRQTALNLFLKATLYAHYRQTGADLPSLSPRGFQDQFADAQKVTGDTAFDRFLLDEIVARVDLDSDEIERVIERTPKLLRSARPAEEIGQLFERLTPQEARRKLGQFRTPPDIADLMARWCIQDGDAQVLDPGMGACSLSAATYRQKQELSSGAKLADIHGVDLNELALVMGATALKLADRGGPHNLQVDDFLELPLEEVGSDMDSVISNPPYSRHHELSENYKSKVNTRAERTLGRDVSALSPMYAYFYYRAAEFLAPGGRASYITPSEFLETNYGNCLKQYLLDEFDIRALVLFDRDEDSVFDEALTTSLVSFLEMADEDGMSDLTRFVRVDDFPGVDVLLNAIADGVEGETEWGFVNIVRQSELVSDDKWTELFNPLEVDTSQLIPLSELATVNRGIATGANAYFCLSQSEVEEWDISEKYLSRLVRNSRSVPYYDYRNEDWERQLENGDDVWLLYHVDGVDWDAGDYQKRQETGDDARLSDFSPEGVSDVEPGTSNIAKYLQYGMSDGVEAHNSYLASHREPWYVVDRRDPAPILVTYMSRGGCRFILNKTLSRNLNNLHGIYVDAELSDIETKALLAFLNSGFADDVVRRSGRTYSTGMDKIEPNELENVPVLDPRELQDEAVNDLAQAFDNLCEAAREDEADTDTILAEIDALLERRL